MINCQEIFSTHKVQDWSNGQTFTESLLLQLEETTINWYHLLGYRSSYRPVPTANGNTVVTEGVQDIENNGAQWLFFKEIT